jgi:hypothetical protein
MAPHPQVDFVAGMHRLPRLDPPKAAPRPRALKDFHLESTPHVRPFSLLFCCLSKV